jgi:UDP-N-acetylmuramoylalanine--D-glutamate ligase
LTKRIVILGGGESGAGAAVLAKKKGFDVFLSDFGTVKEKYQKLLNDNNISWEQNQHSKDKILNADEVIKSPGIADKVPIMKEIFQKNIPVISEIEFADRYTDAKKICITGSNGKTTTTLLIYHILKSAGLNVGLAGNVGNSLALQVAENDFDYYVIELSSFQLDYMFDFKADIAILMNITPDHLDRYNNNFQEYVDSKLRIIQNQGPEDHFIFFYDDPVIKKELESIDLKANLLPFSSESEIDNGAHINEENLFITLKNSSLTMTLIELALQGKHNAYNSMAAGLTASVLKIRKQVIRESLADFNGVEHRMEHVVKVNGIEFINDSKATNVNSTWYALETIQAPIVWIVGGVDKGNDYSMLDSLVKEKVKAIICLGEDNKKIKSSFDGIVGTIVEAKSMFEAVKAAYYLGRSGDKVLLSPACASFDLFENYEDRGYQFKRAVREL